MIPERLRAVHDLATRGSPLLKAAVKNATRTDSWINLLTGLGGGRDRSLQTQVANFNLLQPRELDALYHGYDLPARIVDKVVDDAMRRGFCTGDPAVDAQVTAWKAAERVTEARKWGRLYGVGGIILGLSDRLGPMDAPVDLRQVGPGDLQYLLVVDRQDIQVADRDYDPSSIRYGEIKTIRVGTSQGVQYQGTPVHVSRMILFKGVLTAERQKARNGGWDFSVLQRPSQVLSDFDQSWRSMMNLVQDLSLAVIRIKGLMDMIAEGQKEVMLDRMEVVNMARSVAGLMILDAEEEGFEQVAAGNASAIDPILMRIAQRVATAADMPATVLLGISPAGMNATGESDIRLWYDRVEVERTQELTEPCLTLAQVIARSSGLVPPSRITWPPLWQPTPTEAADLRTKQVTADKTEIDSGVLTAEEVTKIRYQGIPPAQAIDMTLREHAPVTAPPEPPAPGEEPDPSTMNDEEIAADTDWTDTEDGHRMRVTAVTPAVIRYIDLDGPNPNRQYQWARSYFLERCRPAAPPPTEAP